GQSSSDLGLAFLGKLAKGKLEYHLGVYNGEGFTRPEANKFKEIQGRLTYKIKPGGKANGLRATAYYGYGMTNANDADKARAILMLSYEADNFTVGAEAVKSQNGTAGGPEVTGNGASVF